MKEFLLDLWAKYRALEKKYQFGIALVAALVLFTVFSSEAKATAEAGQGDHVEAVVEPFQLELQNYETGQQYLLQCKPHKGSAEIYLCRMTPQ